MRIVRLAFEPERAHLAVFGVVCVTLMLSFGFDGLIVAAGVAAAAVGEQRIDLAAGLILVTVAYVWGGVTAIWRITSNLRSAAARGQASLVGVVAGAEPAQMERVGPPRVLRGLTTAPATILATAPLLARGLRTGCYIIGTLIVLVSLAWQLFGVMAAVLLLTFISLAWNQRAVMAALADATALEAATYDDIGASLGGFKELKLNAARRKAFLAGLRKRTQAASVAQARASRRQTLGFVLQASGTIAASAICIFVIPVTMEHFSTVTLIAAAVLMSNVSLSPIRDLPVLVRGEAAIDEMERLGLDLQASSGERPPLTLAEAVPKQAALTLRRLVYGYPDENEEPGFMLGPLDLDIAPGTITFVLGGNSSGKTTLMNLLAGVYAPASGKIMLNGQDAGTPLLRESSCAIFADHYLFDRLYGLPGLDASRVNQALADMGIGHRTRFVDGRFTSVDLSTGQRKRLAWVAGTLEARPLLLLDQWSADQDPEFRERFYRELLPAQRAAGRTIVAITHDDRYYDVADRLIRLEAGRLVEL